MDEKQIAFIICVNDDFEYAECQYYLSKLKVPEGFSMDVITIREATSMAEGYNAGMQSSNAKYKVYMHQDTFIINENFIQDVLEAFAQDDQIGMMGVVGCRMIPEDAVAVSAWDTGKIEHNFGSLFGYQNGQNLEVDAVDGLLMVTQYDVPWREDLFTKWDYYDISQCYEFRRAGYKTVVPYQDECWCFHDNKLSQTADYMNYRKVFVNEYQDFFSFEEESDLETERVSQYEELNVGMKRNVEQLIDLGKMKEVEKVLSLDETKAFSLLEEYRVIRNILDMEQNNDSQIHFYHRTMNHTMLMEHLRALRHYLKRVEYGKGGYDAGQICEVYSLYAILIIATTYCDNLRKVTAWINETYGINIDLGEYSYKELNRRNYSIVDFSDNPLVFANNLSDFNHFAANFPTSIQNALVIISREEGQITESRLAERIKEIRCHDVTMVRGVLRDEIYVKGRAIIICGVQAKDYASLYHNTDIPVKWYVEDTAQIRRNYSSNIEIIHTEQQP